MADPALALVGDVLVELLREGLVRLKPRARHLVEHLRVAAEPPEGVTFHSHDGASYTGLVLLDHNEVVMMLAARSDPPLVGRPERRERPPLVTPPPAPSRSYSGSTRSLYEHDDPDERDWDEPPGYGRYK